MITVFIAQLLGERFARALAVILRARLSIVVE